ncbi:Hypothetical predicted protein, partial [Olea europaea subsp. europaea]
DSTKELNRILDRLLNTGRLATTALNQEEKIPEKKFGLRRTYFGWILILMIWIVQNLEKLLN